MFSKGPFEVTFNTKEMNSFIQEESQDMNTKESSSQEQTTNIEETSSQKQATEENTLINNMNVETE
ncbi:13764_t:CDS:1, partial [Cetraspora pellucida]